MSTPLLVYISLSNGIIFRWVCVTAYPQSDPTCRSSSYLALLIHSRPIGFFYASRWMPCLSWGTEKLVCESRSDCPAGFSICLQPASPSPRSSLDCAVWEPQSRKVSSCRHGHLLCFYDYASFLPMVQSLKHWLWMSHLSYAAVCCPTCCLSWLSHHGFGPLCLRISGQSTFEASRGRMTALSLC